MEDFQEKIGEILSDPESMAQVMKLVSALAPTMRDEVDKNRVNTPPSQELPKSLSDAESELIHQPSVETAAKPLELQATERSSFQKQNKPFGSQKGLPADHRCDLLLALKPYLRPSRAAMTDQIVQLLRVGDLLGIDIKKIFK